MFYFFHATTIENFKNIIESGYIYSSKYSPFEVYGMTTETKTSKYVFANIYVDGLPLKEDEKMGIGKITLIIDPIILKYKICYVNPFGWYGNEYDKTIIMNNNVDLVLALIKKNYKYPLVTSHEALFKKKISAKFIIGIICDAKYQELVRKILDNNNYDYVQIFNKFPKLIE
jgi:hypothetical protein